MKALLMTTAVILCVALPLAAQPNMDGFEFTDYLRDDGFRIFFDASVDWNWGGILQSPMTEFWQTRITVDAWLVLVQPTAAEIGGFRIGRLLEGSHAVLLEEPAGLPLVIQVVDDVVTGVFDPPHTMTGDPVVLVHWQILNPTFAPVAFFLWPAYDDETPVYFDGTGVPVQANTHTGDFHGYTVPAVILNGMVSPNEGMSFGDVKRLYR